jgi:hypothetical protein
MSRNTIREDRWHIKDIVENYRPPTPENPEGDGDLCLPKSQRGWSWKNKRGKKKQTDLIDSVMDGIPIPSCILNRINHRKFHVYDGRHRFETFYQYTNDVFEWKGKKYSQLTADEKSTFDEREIPVTIVSNISKEQLCEMFVRVNSGASLKDYDMLWANMDKSLMQSVRDLIQTNNRLSQALGNIDMFKREDLSNWTAIMCGLATNNAGNITTSHIRVFDDIGLDYDVNRETVQEGLDALCILLETANERFPTTDKGKQSLKKVGKLIAFFFGDWIESTNKEQTIEKWVDIIGRLRGADSGKMSAALSTKGAQNLTAKKIAMVLDNVKNYLENNTIHVTDDGSDDESQ